jgi:hypothetical protein
MGNEGVGRPQDFPDARTQDSDSVARGKMIAEGKGFRLMETQKPNSMPVLRFDKQK